MFEPAGGKHRCRAPTKHGGERREGSPMQERAMEHEVSKGIWIVYTIFHSETTGWPLLSEINYKYRNRFGSFCGGITPLFCVSEFNSVA